MKSERQNKLLSFYIVSINTMRLCALFQLNITTIDDSWRRYHKHNHQKEEFKREPRSNMMMEDALRETPRRWSCYRNCTNYMSLCNLIFGLLLISLWVACFERCLSRMSIENDAAAPLWTGIVVRMQPHPNVRTTP